MQERTPVTSAPPANPASTEENVYTDVYRMLIAGMIVSSVLFAIGILLAMLHPQYVPLTSRWIRSEYHVRLVVHGLLHGDPSSIMLVATVLLILTPVARVVVSIVAFLIDRDYKFVAVTSFVFLIMVVTVILGELGLK
ncbi:MAG TPA: DUF1634 domain-containing protein [Terriglobales bacterium]|nr:DUF1634 domain-containing protein [Terriglobales bacterium]